MLILSRKSNESIMLGDDIEITVLSVIGKTVKLGIQAPQNIFVHRKEIYEAIKNENLKAITKENVLSLADILRDRRK